MQKGQQINRVLIHFNDVSVCLESIKELGIDVNEEAKKHITEVHNSVYGLRRFIPISDMPNIYFRAANFILRIIESYHSVKLNRYKKSNYQLY